MSKSKFFHTGRHDDAPNTAPSRRGELTLRDHLDRREQHRHGWRRNLTVAALIVIACVVARYLTH